MSSQFELDDDLVSGSGHWFLGEAGGTLTDREAVYMDANGRFQAADADGAATMPCMGLTISAGTVGQNVMILTRGFVNVPSGPWTAGSELYVSTATGALTHTAPVAIGDIVQQVGIAYSTTQIWFDPEGEGMGVASGCPILDGATAYVGSDACMSPHLNYFYTGDYANHTLLFAAAVDYVATLGGGSISLEAMTYTGIMVVDENEVFVYGQGWDTYINGTTAGHAIAVTGDSCVIRDLRVSTTTDAGNYDGVNVTGGADTLIENVWVSESDREGVNLAAGSDSSRVTNCLIEGTNENGVSTASPLVRIENNEINNAGDFGIEMLATGDNSIISNNVIGDTDNDGIVIHADCENVVVEGNYITAWTGEAIDDNSGTASIGNDNWAGAGSYEVQTGIVAVPTVTAGGAWQGRDIEVENSDEGRYFSWSYQNAGWRGVEYL